MPTKVLVNNLAFIVDAVHYYRLILTAQFKNAHHIGYLELLPSVIKQWLETASRVKLLLVENLLLVLINYMAVSVD